MGESKRRKMLDPDYGKPRSLLLNKAIATQSTLSIIDEFKIHFEEKRYLDELARKKMKRCLDKLERLKSKSGYQEGVILLFKACLNQDESYNDTLQQLEDIKKAGNLIYETRGINGLCDDSLWNFIPKSMERVVDVAWDKIGEWRC